jgi:DNA-binding transcriptional regulator YdaS (Cro superfamily)
MENAHHDILRIAVGEAVRAAGGGAALAKHLKLNRQAVYQWARIPADHVLTVERVTSIPRHRLRPDLYPEPDRVAS